MNLTVKYYGLVAEITGKNTEHLEYKEMPSVKNLKQALQKEYPELEEATFQIAVNQQIADQETPIKDGDEIALLPPFAGG